IERDGEPLAVLVSVADASHLHTLHEERGHRIQELFSELANRDPEFHSATDDEIEASSVRAIREVRADAGTAD
ncbi:MAG TPA: hypothetical protein PJ994_04365, partial [Tepidiformaceae bacterium]|nr:hypothetical protein [Tepidiformaceae bacterium]